MLCSNQEPIIFKLTVQPISKSVEGTHLLDHKRRHPLVPTRLPLEQVEAAGDGAPRFREDCAAAQVLVQEFRPEMKSGKLLCNCLT